MDQSLSVADSSRRRLTTAIPAPWAYTASTGAGSERGRGHW